MYVPNFLLLFVAHLQRRKLIYDVINELRHRKLNYDVVNSFTMS